MEISVKFDWKEVLALAGALLLGIGAGVTGSALLRQIDDKPIEIQVDKYNSNLKDYNLKQMR